MRRRLALVAAATAVLAAVTAYAVAGRPHAATGIPAFDHVWVVLMENTGAGRLVGNPNAPWIDEALHRYPHATRYYGVTHPSQPNYIALTSGSPHGVTGDGPVTLRVRNLVDQLEAHGKTWRDYQQSLALCGGDKLKVECGNQLYERKHNPFVSYRDVRSDPARMADVVPLAQLRADLAAGRAPDFSFVAPDGCHNMHGRSAPGPCNAENRAGLIRAGDRFLRGLVGRITSSTAWTRSSAIFVVWDESEDHPRGPSGCCDANPGGGRVVALAILGDGSGPRASATPVNHYSLLATIERAWKLGCLGHTCETDEVPTLADLLVPKG